MHPSVVNNKNLSLELVILICPQNKECFYFDLRIAIKKVKEDSYLTSFELLPYIVSKIVILHHS